MLLEGLATARGGVDDVDEVVNDAGLGGEAAVKDDSKEPSLPSASSFVEGDDAHAEGEPSSVAVGIC